MVSIASGTSVPTSSSRLESLHTELLEMICDHVARMEAMTHEMTRCWNCALRITCHTPGKADCRTLRLVSKRFASLDVPCRALFRDFHLLVTEDSLRRFERVALHPRLRHFVTRVTFFSPFFLEEFTDFDSYEDQLTAQVRYEYRERLWRSAPEEWDQYEQEIMVDALVDESFPYSYMAQKAGHKAYVTLLREQSGLLQKSTFASRAAVCLDLCPRITSAFVVDRDPLRSPEYFDLGPFGGRGTWRARNDWMSSYYPELLLPFDAKDSVLSAVQRSDRAHCHVGVVMDTLARSKVQLRELVTDMGQGFKCSFGWEAFVSATASTLIRPPQDLLDVSRVETLHLALSVASLDTASQDWSACLSPLLAMSTNLRELSLLFGDMVPAGDEIDMLPSFEKLLNLRFPRLRDLFLQSIRFGGQEFSTFLGRHPTLRTITLQEFFVEDSHWKAVFDSIKHHPSIDDVEICVAKRPAGDTDWVCVSSSLTEEENVEGDGLDDTRTKAHVQLQKYILGDGPWTEKLKWNWEDGLEEYLSDDWEDD